MPLALPTCRHIFQLFLVLNLKSDRRSHVGSAFFVLQDKCLVAARTQNKMGIIYYLSLRSDVSHQAYFRSKFYPLFVLRPLFSAIQIPLITRPSAMA